MTPSGYRTLKPWLLLALLSIAFTAVMRHQQVPAAFMLGPLLAAVIMALSGAGLRVSRTFTLGAQGVMGCLIAAFVTPSLMAVFSDHWRELLAINLATMALIVFMSVAIARSRWLPDTTAIWGLFPGAASSMVLLADTHHADARIVAMLQYSRILLVSVASASFAALLGHAPGTLTSLPDPLKLGWEHPGGYVPTLTCLALAACGYLASRLSGMGALALLLPAFAGTILQSAGLISIEVPALIFIPAFVVTGWYVGLTFDRSAVRHCLSLLPVMLCAIVAVIGLCGLMAFVLMYAVPDIDALTAYLALSPGGIETIVIVARDSDVFLPLILASQFVRLFIVMSIGPGIAKAVAGWQLRHPSTKR